MTEELFTLNDLLKLGSATLRTIPDDEIDVAVAWLEEHCCTAVNVAAQLILYQTWVSTWSRNIYERIYQEGR